MIHPASHDEVYVMNLLGHLKLAHESGMRHGAEEYVHAYDTLGQRDPVDYLSHELAHQLVSGALPTGWPRQFHDLRRDLDAVFAPDPNEFQPRRLATSSEVLALLSDSLLGEMSRQWNVSPDRIFDHAKIERLEQRPQWKIPGGLTQVEKVRAIIRAAPHQIGDTDLLQWVLERLVAIEYRDKVREFVCRSIIEPAAAETAQIEEQEVAFRYGLLTPLLSYAALDRRLVRIQMRIAKAAQDTLQDCLNLCPCLRNAVELRVISDLELQGNYRRAAGLLSGELATAADEDDRDESYDESVSSTSTFSGRSSEFENLIAQMAPNKRRSPDEAAQAEQRVRDLESAAPQRFHWEPIAQTSRDVDFLLVKWESDSPVLPPSPGLFQKLFGRPADPVPAVERIVVRCQPGNDVVLRISESSDEERRLLEQRLPQAFTQASGKNLRERIGNAVLVAAKQKSAAQPPTPADVQLGLLLGRALEILQPKPLVQFGGSLADALSSPASLALPAGEGQRFTLPTLHDVLHELNA